MLAFLNAATANGLVKVPSSLVPRGVNGEPVIGTLNIGENRKVSFLGATFYGIGGAQLETETGLVNVGFVLYGRRGRTNDEAVNTFRELGGEAGVLVHIQDSFGGVRNYDNPLVLWALKVYSTLRGSSWLSQIDEITETTTFHFNPFTASVETLKRFNAPAQSDQFIDRLLTGPDDAELSARDLALLEAHLQQPVCFATIQREKQATGRSPTEEARNKLKLIRDFNRRLHQRDAASTSTEPAPKVVAEAVAPAGPSGFLGGTALADALGVHPSRRDAFFKQLERDRISLGDENWQEVSNRRANTPRYQYRADSPKLREMANTYKEPKPA
jgi:hypothetical protein